MTGRITALLWTAGLVLAMGLGAWLEPRSEAWRGRRAQADSLLWTLLGDGRRLFANHFFVKADVYLHSGYYPSIFDQAQRACEHGVDADAHDHGGHNGEPTDGGGTLAAAAVGEVSRGSHEHEKGREGVEGGFMGPPRDWIDRLSRHFKVTEHTHLSGGRTEAEVLPWLRVAAEFDPHQVEVYTTAAYWLANRLGKPDQAEAFLRRGLRANPDSEEILFELGRLAWQHRRNADRARHLWQAAERAWHAHNPVLNETNRLVLSRIVGMRAQMEEDLGNYEEAIRYWTKLQELSPQPEAIARRVASLRDRLSGMH